MAHIRFHCMSKEFLQSVVLGNELIQQENSWKEQVEGALDFHNRPKRQLSPQLRAMATPRRAPNVLYLIGEASTRVEMFDLEKGSCFPVDGMAQTNANTASTFRFPSQGKDLCKSWTRETPLTVLARSGSLTR